MSQERSVDIIDHAKNFHSELSEYYHKLSGIADKERVRILLNYLSENEKKQEEALAEYEGVAPHEVMDTWFKYGPDIPEKSFEEEKMSADMDVDAVVHEAVRLDNYLSEMYKTAITRAQSESIKKVFINLLALNEKHIRDLVRDSEHLTDW